MPASHGSFGGPAHLPRMEGKGDAHEGTPRLSQEPSRRGVALPTWRQARRVSRMNPAERAALHGSCPHRERDCPVEAALTATFYRVETLMYAAGIAFVWLCTLLVWLIAQSDHDSLRAGSYDA